MATATYTPLANITLGSTAASVTFSSISQAYRDLVLVCQVTGSVAQNIYMRLNADTGANYNYVYMTGNGSAASSSIGSASNFFILSGGVGTSTSASNTVIASIFDFTATDKHKSVLSRVDRANAGTNATASRWAGTSAVTEVQIYPSTSTWAAGSTFALYGIAA